MRSGRLRAALRGVDGNTGIGSRQRRTSATGLGRNPRPEDARRPSSLSDPGHPGTIARERSRRRSDDGQVDSFRSRLGLSDQAIKELKRISESDLTPMIRVDEKFDLDFVLEYFNKLFKKRK